MENLDKIIDIVLLAILVICGWSGYKKGIIMGIGGILVIIVSVFGANLLSNTFSYEVTPVMQPFASGYIESKLNEDETGILAELGLDNSTFSLSDLLIQDPSLESEISQRTFRFFGFSEEVAAELTDEVIANSDETGDDLITSISEILCARVAFVLCFLLAFALIAILLTVIGNIPNLSFKFPVANIINDIGGLLLGLVTGLLFCSLVTWVFKYTGLIIKEDVLAETWLASRLIEKDLLTQYIGL